MIVTRADMRSFILAASCTLSCCLIAALPKLSDLETWEAYLLLVATIVTCILLYNHYQSPIQAEWNSYQSKRFLQVMKLSIDTSTEVVRILANQNLLQNYGGSLTTFLQSKKHYFFHQWEKGKFTCVCSPAGCNIQRSKSMANWLFKKIYSRNSNPVGGHFIVRNKNIEQHCIHAYAVNPGILIDTVDITVLVFILRHCGALSVQQSKSLEDIAFIRNQICHAFSTKQYTEKELDKMWNTLEQAILLLVPLSFKGIIKEQIRLLTRVDFECEEIESMGRKINEIKTMLQAIDESVNRNGMCMETSKELDTSIQGAREDIRELQNTVEKNGLVTMDLLQSFKDKENSLAVYFGKFEKRFENLETIVRTYACCRSIEEGIKDSNDSKCIGEKNENIDLYIKIPSGQLDEDTAVQELRKIVQKKNEAFRIKSVERNCVLIELEIPRDHFTDEIQLESSFSSIIQSILHAGHVDTDLSASMNLLFVIQSTITTDELNVLKNMSSYTSFSPINDESADSGESSCTEDEDARRVNSEEENFFQTKKWSKLDDTGGYRVTVETAVQVDLLSVPYVNKITKDNKSLREELTKMKEAYKNLKKELKRFQGKRHTNKRRKFAHDSRSRKCSRESSSVPKELGHDFNAIKRSSSEPVHLQELMTTSESESRFMHVSSEMATSESDVSYKIP